MVNFLSGGGEMGALSRKMDWASTPLGPAELWPQSLRTTVSIILNSKFPMFLWWGEDHIQFYNDAYRPSLGNNGKHPIALGQKGEDCWPEIWSFVKPILDSILSGGEAYWNEDQLLPIYRNGHMEDVYWTFSYSPVHDETGKPAGVFVTCVETTQKVATINSLKESEDQLLFAIEATELGTFDYNPATDHFSANERLKDWFGLPQETELELPLAISAIAVQDRERVIAAIETALQYSSGGFYNVNYTIIHPLTGKERIVKAKGRAWFNSNRIAYRFNGTLQDITEQETAYRKMEDSEHRFRNVIEQSPVRTILFTGRDMKVETANETVYASWKKREDVIGKAYIELRPELKGQPFMQLLDDVYTSGIPYAAKETAVKMMNNGILETRYFDFWYKPVFNASGNIYGILSTSVEMTDKVLAQKQLEDQKEYLQNAVNIAELGTFKVDLNTRLGDFSDNVRELFGITSATDMLSGMALKVHPDDLKMLRDTIAASLTHEEDSRHDITYRITSAKDGAQHYLRSIGNILFTDGKPHILIGILQDVTTQIIARQKMEESEARFRTMVQQVPIAIGLTRGRDMIFESINPHMLDLMNRKIDIIGQPFLDVIPKIKGQHLADILFKVYESGQPYTGFDIPAKLWSDSILEQRYFDVSYTPLIENSKVTGLLHVLRDVTGQMVARKKAEAAEAEVRTTAERLQLALDAARLGSYELILATGKIYSTPQCKENFGLRHDEQIDYRQLIAMILPEDRTVPQQNLALALANHTHYMAEYRITRPDGAIRWIRATGKPIYDELANPVKVTGIVLDITEEKNFSDELNKKVRESTMELHRSNEDLLQFAHVTSHDLKEPVRKIKIFSNRLQDEFGPQMSAKGLAYLEKIQNATDRMFMMIEGVLTFSAINASEEQITAVSLEEIIFLVETDLELVVLDKNATITRSWLPHIEGTFILIYQLFYNLINNALKFTKAEEPSRINISSVIINKDGRDFAQINIQDNGIGFEDLYAQKIFDTFARLNSKDAYEGTGLGLALCKRIAERHQGTISASGVLNEGAVFTVCLPLKHV